MGSRFNKSQVDGSYSRQWSDAHASVGQTVSIKVQNTIALCSRGITRFFFPDRRLSWSSPDICEQCSTQACTFVSCYSLDGSRRTNSTCAQEGTCQTVWKCVNVSKDLAQRLAARSYASSQPCRRSASLSGVGKGVFRKVLARFGEKLGGSGIKS